MSVLQAGTLPGNISDNYLQEISNCFANNFCNIVLTICYIYLIKHKCNGTNWKCNIKLQEILILL